MNGDKPNKLKPALIAGVALGVVSPIAGCVNMCCCALAIGGGVLATYLYFKDQPKAAEPPYGDGAVVGLLTGVIGGLVYPVVALPLNLILSRIGPAGNPEQMAELMDKLRQVFEDNDLPVQLVDILEGMSAGGFDPVMFFAGMAFWLVAYAIFATLGGVLGVTFFGKKKD